MDARNIPSYEAALCTAISRSPLCEAASILHDKLQNGDMLCNIIYLTYIAPERLMAVEICSRLRQPSWIAGLR